VDEKDIENIELDLLLQAIYQRYGYDYRNYAKASVRRRVRYRMQQEGCGNIAELLHNVLYSPEYFERLFLDLSINVTEMFRDPQFYLAVRQFVAPKLREYPFLKVWHAGCSTGEEVYSMAVLLKEEGVYDRLQIYATDMNQMVLQKAKAGIYPINRQQMYTANYQKAGGKESFSDYYSAHYDHVVVDKSLRENILFSDHNLATDGVFGEMNLIVCRNVLIYFNRELQNRVFGLFYDSLCEGGYLCLGSKESIRFSDYANRFEDVVREEKIYRKIA